MTEKTTRRSKPWLWLLPVLLLLAAAVGAYGWFRHTYLIYDGHPMRRDLTHLDYRGTELTEEAFAGLTGLYPNAEIRWDVPLSGGGRDSASETVRLTDISRDDFSLFRYFPALDTVDGRECTNPDVLMALQEALPDVRVLWQVELEGRAFPQDTRALTLSGSADAAALAEKLSCLPELSLVTFRGGAVAREDQDLLRETFPHMTFSWSTELLGRVYTYGTTDISLVGEPLTGADLREIQDNAFRLPSLRSIDLTGCGFDNDTLHALDVALGDIDVVWTLEIYGMEFCSTDEEIDLSRYSIRDHAAELEAMLPYFSHLKKIDMSRCGIPNEEMDALNRKYEDIRFVWTVFFSIFSVRTDATNFIAARTINEASIYSNECSVLRYCTDMIALDLGHRNLTHLDFLYDMPQLQYLILVENDINDITPIGSLKELKYLEMFWTKCEDISPLINCTKLLDLNICYIYSRPGPAFETLMQMPWLERLWYCGSALTQEQIDALQANMPQCEMYMAKRGESTGSTWREHPRYFEMRDVFDMFYMPGGTNGVAPDGSQIVVRG